MVMTVPDALAKKILETWQAIGHARSDIEHDEYGMACGRPTGSAQ